MSKNVLKSLFSIEFQGFHIYIKFCFLKFKMKNIKKMKQIIKDLTLKNRDLELENDCLFKNYKNFSHQTNSTKIYLLNDTSREFNHIGCLKTQENIKKMCLKNNLSINFSDFTDLSQSADVSNWADVIKASDILVFNGEGTTHDNQAVSMFKKCEIAKKMNKKVYLINAVWQNNTETQKYLDCFDFIFLRESLSYASLPDSAKNKAAVVSDMVFYDETQCENRNAVKKIIFTDSVIPEITKKLERLAREYNSEFYYMDSAKKDDKNYLSTEIFKNLSSESLIITGRFHAFIMGMKYKIPTLAVKSNTHKIEGLAKDSNLENYCVLNVENIENEIKNFINSPHEDFKIKSGEYIQNARRDIEKMFLKIAQNGENA